MIAFRIASSHRQRGVTLIELMVSLILGVLIMLGLVTLMNSVGVTNRVQDGMARMQENGRYALQRITEDLRAASSQYCSNFGAVTGRLGTGAGGTAEYYLEQVRPISAHYNVGANTPNGLLLGPSVAAAPTAAGVWPTGGSPNLTYLISPRFMLFGSECGASTCAPTVNAANRGTDPTVFAGGRASMGVNAGNRARGADTLTIRYVSGSGTPITAMRNQGAESPDLPIEIDVANPASLGIANTTTGQVLVTDCGVSDLLRMRVSGATLTATGNYQDFRMPLVSEDARAFNMERDLRQISYFVQVKDDPDPTRLPANRKILVLMRSQNGVTEEIVEGVERLDFMYGVDDDLGRTRFLTAQQVDAMAADCPPNTASALGFSSTYFGAPEPGCGWHAVKTVEVSLLMNTVTDAALTNGEQFRYSFTNTGAVNTANAYENPATLGTMYSGLPPYRMLRREFRTQVGLRGYNY